MYTRKKKLKDEGLAEETLHLDVGLSTDGAT